MTAPSDVYAVVLAAHVGLFLALSLRVAGLRRRLRVGIGEGKAGDPAFYPLKRAIRVHGNFIEAVPITMLTLYVVEQRGAGVAWVAGLGGAVLLGRLGHAWGLSRSPGASVGRMGGLALHWGALAVMAALMLAL